jgi:phosphoglucomutase
MLTPEIQAKVEAWTRAPYDQETQAEVTKMLAEERYSDLTDAFYQDLEFGTGGLRGIMGVGSNRMNRYTVGAATQGFAVYLQHAFPAEQVSVVIAHDSRNNSPEFARLTADIFSAHGIKVYLFPELRPTPLLSFAIRYLKCHAGVVLTASHNPKEYNGYKAYWNDGSQLVKPHDKNVIAEVQKVKAENLRFEPNNALIEILDDRVELAYLAEAKKLSLSPDAIQKANIKVAYTSIHGTGITLVPKALQAFGFGQVFITEKQATPDGNFPTVVYPNPEEAEAMSLGLEKAKEVEADVLLGTDPDTDRVGIALKNHKGEWQLLNGNQTGVLLLCYLMRGKDWGNNTYIAKTIVTTELIDRIAEKNNITCYNTLTGFKYIAEIMREQEGKSTYIGGCEESYGYLIGSEVRDKDAVSACALIAEAVAYAKSIGKTAFEYLLDIYAEYGLYHENLVSITKKGKTGAEEIQAMMKRFRENPPQQLAGSAVVEIRDYQTGKIHNLATGETKETGLESSNVLQFITANGAKVSARPSGTEPKIKFYFSLNAPFEGKEKYDSTIASLEAQIKEIVKDLNV